MASKAPHLDGAQPVLDPTAAAADGTVLEGKEPDLTWPPGGVQDDGPGSQAQNHTDLGAVSGDSRAVSSLGRKSPRPELPLTSHKPGLARQLLERFRFNSGCLFTLVPVTSFPL
ncbi:hypothetical protein FGRMN_1325 [Fusarium graminum]|nr:hypothetical protein FGRMN_1325 [Fusarium graminum]